MAQSTPRTMYNAKIFVHCMILKVLTTRLHILNNNNCTKLPVGGVRTPFLLVNKRAFCLAGAVHVRSYAAAATKILVHTLVQISDIYFFTLRACEYLPFAIRVPVYISFVVGLAVRTFVQTLSSSTLVFYNDVDFNLTFLNKTNMTKLTQEVLLFCRLV